MEKPIKSKLDAHEETLLEWERAKVTLDDMAARLKAQGVECSRSGISDFLTKRRRQRDQEARDRQILESIANGSRLGRVINTAMETNPAPEMEIIGKLLRALVMELGASGTIDEERLKTLDPLLKRALECEKLKQNKEVLAQNERKLKLVEEKEAKAKEVLGDQGLTAEQKQARMKEVFGIS